MKLQEEEQPFYGRTIGYCNHGQLYSRPAPYIHHAVCNKGELGTANLRTEQKIRGRKPRRS